MYSLLVRVDQIMDAAVVSAHLYDVDERGLRTLVATREDWFDPAITEDQGDSLSCTLAVIRQWADRMGRNQPNG